MFRKTFLTATLLAAALPALAEPFTIVTLGDTAYGDPAKAYPQFEALIATINAVKPELVIHVGDIKSGSTPCSDENLLAHLESASRLWRGGDGSLRI